MIAKPERHRCPAHLRFVATVPCVACSGGRMPGREWLDRGAVSQAHHVLFAQPRARGLKPGDQHVVPVCPAHHDQIHRAGNERAWWAGRGIDPLDIAERLWRASVAAGRVRAVKVAA